MGSIGLVRIDAVLNNWEFKGQLWEQDICNMQLYLFINKALVGDTSNQFAITRVREPYL